MAPVCLLIVWKLVCEVMVKLTLSVSHFKPFYVGLSFSFQHATVRGLGSALVYVSVLFACNYTRITEVMLLMNIVGALGVQLQLFNLKAIGCISYP